VRRSGSKFEIRNCDSKLVGFVQVIKGVGVPDISPGRGDGRLEGARDVLSLRHAEIRTPASGAPGRPGIEGTDIVEGDVHQDRGGESLTLRPEATASLMRAYMEHSLGGKSSLVKLYLIGPMFRHERPKSGRFRQFHQIDAEAVGSPGPAVDAEVIALLHHLLEVWGLTGILLDLNSIGDPVCRPAYRQAFVTCAGPSKRPARIAMCGWRRTPCGSGLQGADLPRGRGRSAHDLGLSVRAVPRALCHGAKPAGKPEDRA
jgi:hypothetical protein